MHKSRSAARTSPARRYSEAFGGRLPSPTALTGALVADATSAGRLIVGVGPVLSRI